MRKPLMKFLPFDDFNIITPLSPTAAGERLLKDMEPLQFHGFTRRSYKSSGPYFSGYAFNAGFKLQPVIPGNNVFLPQITVSISPSKNGSSVHIKMQIHLPAMIVMFVCLGIFCPAGISEFIINTSRPQFGLATIFILAFCLFAYLLTMFCFKPDARDAKAKLLKILDGKIEQQDRGI